MAASKKHQGGGFLDSTYQVVGGQPSGSVRRRGWGGCSWVSTLVMGIMMLAFGTAVGGSLEAYLGGFVDKVVLLCCILVHTICFLHDLLLGCEELSSRLSILCRSLLFLVFPNVKISILFRLYGTAFKIYVLLKSATLI